MDHTKTTTMRWTALVTAALLVGLAGVGALATSWTPADPAESPASAADHPGEVVDVEAGDYYFEPAYLVIEPGTMVRWTNVGEDHHHVVCHAPVGPTEVASCVGDDLHGHMGAHDDPATPEDERVFEHVFEEQGVYVLHCDLSGDHDYMKMTIVVTP